MAMNSDTHKVIVARYEGPIFIYAVPMDWNVADICIRYGGFYYKGKQVNPPPEVEFEGDHNEPPIIEESDDFDLETWFDCE